MLVQRGVSPFRGCQHAIAQSRERERQGEGASESERGDIFENLGEFWGL